MAHQMKEEIMRFNKLYTRYKEKKGQGLWNAISGALRWSYRMS